MLKSTIAAAVLLSAAALSAQTPAPAQGGAQADNPNEVICRNVSSTTDSRLSRTRVCKTRAEWAEQRRGSRRGSGDRAPSAGNTQGE